MEGLCLLHHFRRDVDNVELGAERLVAPFDRPHADQIDNANKVVLDPDRQLQHQRTGAEAIADHRNTAREIGADPVHFIDKANPRNAVFVGLTPHRLGLRLDTGDRIENGYGAVEHAQATLHLDREINVARRIDDVDPMVCPETRGRGRRDRDAALLLLRHPIHRRGAFVHLADLIVAAGVVEDALGRCRLAGIDMGHDADVSVTIEGGLACH